MRVGSPYDANTHRVVWLLRSEGLPEQPKSDLYPKKVMLLCVWDSKGIVYYELLPYVAGDGRTVTATAYVDSLQKLSDAVKAKRP